MDARFRIDSTNAAQFTLADIDPGEFAKKKPKDVDELEELQEKLHANGTTGLLIVLQGMDTSGKGGAVKSLYSAMNPQGIDLHAFGAPTAEEKKHDFLWRIPTPKLGKITVFDRSHYEDVLIQRVEGMAPMDEIMDRYPAIVDFEAELVQHNIRVVKVMLHISPEFQKDNLLERLERPEKQWKYDPADLTARAKWEEYQQAYELAIRLTATDTAPWYVLPGDNKKYARMLLQKIVAAEIEATDLDWPQPDFDVDQEIEKLGSLPI